jgi:hypothetical protein
MARHQKMADGRSQAAATSEFVAKMGTNTSMAMTRQALSRVAQADFTFSRFNV